MNKLTTSNETSTKWSVDKIETWAFIQNSNIEAMKNIILNLIGASYSTSVMYVLHGCVATGTDPGVRTFSAGAVFFNGEIYTVPAASFTSSGSNIAIATITDVADGTADPTLFSDNTFLNVHRVRTVVISAGLTGTGNADCINFVRISGDASWTDATLAANTTNTGSIYANAGYRKEHYGIIRLRGRVTYTNTSSQSYPTLFTLPASYRPLFGQNFVCEAATSVPFGGSDTHQFSIQIDTAGLVKLINFVRITGAATADISLDGISFPTD